MRRDFAPECVSFDSWYASIDNLRLIRDCGWQWLTQLGSNRLVDPDRTGNRAVAVCDIAASGPVVHLKDDGMVKIFRIVTPAGDTEHWATNDLGMSELERLKYAEFAWGIELYHRALKQECGVGRAMARAGRAQRNHIDMAIRAGCPVGRMRLEWHRVRTGIGWKLAKEDIIRHAIRSYRARRWYCLPASASVLTRFRSGTIEDYLSPELLYRGRYHADRDHAVAVRPVDRVEALRDGDRGHRKQTFKPWDVERADPLPS